MNDPFLDQTQIIQSVYQSDSESLKTTLSGGILVTEQFDYVSFTYPSGTQDVYIYKLGGSSGTTVATVTINYVDSSKAAILNISKA